MSLYISSICHILVVMLTLSPSTSSLLDRKIEETAAGLQTSYLNHLRSINKSNTATIVNYITAMRSEINLSDYYRRDIIELLCKFSNYNNNKNFKELARHSVISFLETYRKTETQDILHKWIGTYNLFRIYLLRFFKWLYSPELEPGKRPKRQLWKIFLS